MHAGALEFSEKGLEAPSLDAICARAGYTRGAFYVHFRDRDDLLAAVVERVLESFQDAVIASTNSSEDLAQTITRYVAAIASGAPVPAGTARWQFHDTLAACARVPALRTRYAALQRRAIERVTEAARAGQRARTVRADVPAETIGEILVMLTLGISTMIDLRESFDLRAGGEAIARFLAAPMAKAKPPRRAASKSKRARKPRGPEGT